MAWGSGRRRRSSIGKPWRSGRSWSPSSPPCRSTASRLAGSHNNLGLLLAGLGKGPEAEEQYRKALAILGEAGRRVPHRAGIPSLRGW